MDASASDTRSNTTHISVTSEPLDVETHRRFVADPAAGCTVLFIGTVRDHAPNRDGVTHLRYEAYGGVVEAKITEVVTEARQRWPVLRIAVSHRTGTLEVGEPAVVVAVATAHRSDGFEAAKYVIDELKARAPIWKKEHWSGGAEWVEGA